MASRLKVALVPGGQPRGRSLENWFEFLGSCSGRRSRRLIKGHVAEFVENLRDKLAQTFLFARHDAAASFELDAFVAFVVQRDDFDLVELLLIG